MFAFGVLLWELVTREVPFDGLDAADIRSKVEKGEQLRVPYGADQRLAALISECRHVQNSARPNFEQIVEVLQQISK